MKKGGVISLKLGLWPPIEGQLQRLFLRFRASGRAGFQVDIITQEGDLIAQSLVEINLRCWLGSNHFGWWPANFERPNDDRGLLSRLSLVPEGERFRLAINSLV